MILSKVLSVTLGIVILIGTMSSCVVKNNVIETTDRVLEEEIEFLNEEGVVLSGTIFRSGFSDRAVVLAHSGVLGEDQTGLHSTARMLAENGITTLTFDFQGCGKTGGELSGRCPHHRCRSICKTRDSPF